MLNNLRLWFVLVTCALLAGCAAKKDPNKPTVALVMKSNANPFFLAMEEGAKDHHAKHAGDYDLFAVGMKNEVDVSEQIKLVENLIAQGVDAIVIAPSDSKALVGVCKKAKDAGIVVINIDNKLDGDVLESQGLKVPFIGPDNRKGARMVAEHLAKQLKPGDPVAIIEGLPSAYNAIQRKLGFEDAIKAAKLELVDSQSGEWELAKAKTVAAGMIVDKPELKAILCANDDMAMGALAALKDAGRDKDVLVVGFDNIPAAQQFLDQGRLLATIDQLPGAMAVAGIETALDMLKKKESPGDRETSVELITKK